jgi:hypothetical protein
MAEENLKIQTQNVKTLEYNQQQLAEELTDIKAKLYDYMTTTA